jgi:Spy/CpxP family protein refolding chaperone
MTGKTFTIALALLLGAAATASAQSQRNYGANGPSAYGCYGQAYTGTVASRCPGTPGGQPWPQGQQRQGQWQQPWPQQEWQQPWQR